MAIPIAFIVSRVQRSGPIIVLRDIIKNLPKGGYIPWIVELRSPLSSDPMHDELVLLGAKFHSLHCSHWKLELKTKEVALTLNKWLLKKGITLVHSHTYHPDLVASYLVKSFQVVTTQHNISKQDFIFAKGYLLGNYMQYRLIQALKRIRSIVGITEYTTQYYLPYLPKSCKSTTIPNGVDTDSFHPLSPMERASIRQSLSISPENYVMIMVGMLCERKNPLTVIAALHLLKEQGRLPDKFLFLFVGEGGLASECQKAIGSLSNQIRLVGFSHKVQQYMQTADVAIAASHSEGFGLTVAECIACGLPVATSSIAPFRELINQIPSLQSLHFDPSNVVECAEAIARCLTFPPISEEERAHFLLRYSAERMGRSYSQLYDQLLKNYDVSSTE